MIGRIKSFFKFFTKPQSVFTILYTIAVTLIATAVGGWVGSIYGFFFIFGVGTFIFVLYAGTKYGFFDWSGL